MNFLSYATQDYTRSQSLYAYLGLDNNWFEVLQMLGLGLT